MRSQIVLIVALSVVVSCSGVEQADQESNTSTSVGALAEELDAGLKSAPSADPNVPAEDVAELRERIYGILGESDLALHLRHEEMLEQCMKAQGFEYVPLPYPGDVSSPNVSLSDNREEFVRRYGYGKSTLYEAEEIASAVVAATYVDPNEEIFVGMSDAERDAYNEAMYGAPAEGTRSEDGSYVPASPRAGCSGEAAAVYGGVQALDISNEAQQALLNVEQFVHTDPKVRAAQDRWATCMTSAGYDVAAPDDTAAIVDSWMAPLLATDATKTVSATDPNGNPITVSVPDLDQKAFTDVQQREIDLAIVDLECDEESALTETIASVRSEIQERVISQWYGELSTP